MKKIIFAILAFCIMLSAIQPAFAARESCATELENPMYKMVGGKISGDVPVLKIKTGSVSSDPLAFHIVLEGAEWDINKMSSIDKNIQISPSAADDIQVKYSKDYMKQLIEEERRELSLPLYAKNFSDGIIKLYVTDTPSYMDKAEYIFAYNAAGTLSGSYGSSGEVYMTGISVLPDITLRDTGNFEAVPDETYFTINVSGNDFIMDTLPDIVGTGKYEGIVKAEITGSARLKITTTQTSPTGMGTIVVKGLQIKKISKYKINSPEITVSGVRTVSFKANDGSIFTQKFDYSNKFTAGTVIDGVSPYGTSAVQEKQSVTQNAYSTLMFKIGETGYTLNDAYVAADKPCIVAGGYTLLPIRQLCYALGITDKDIYFDIETKTVEIVKNGNVIKIEQNGDYMYVNDERVEVSVPASNYGNSLYLPVRDVCTGLGIAEENIAFDNGSKTITITF